jgi:hypothetical protein
MLGTGLSGMKQKDTDKLVTSSQYYILQQPAVAGLLKEGITTERHTEECNLHIMQLAVF